MPVVEPTNLAVLKLEVLHLYHSGISNCAMRARITLEEKGLRWESHHFDLMKKEHLTPEYFGINPNGLVPTLVHDGKVIVESDDIIDYLDMTFPRPSLRPVDEAGIDLMYAWLQRATEIHLKAVKTHIYEKRMAKSMAQDDAARQRYEELQTDPELLAFHAKSSGQGFSRDELDQAQATLDACWQELDQLLENQDWIAGGQFSLADIAWMPLYFTLGELAGYSFTGRPNVRAWSRRIESRPSFKPAVLDWWPFPISTQALAEASG